MIAPRGTVQKEMNIEKESPPEGLELLVVIYLQDSQEYDIMCVSKNKFIFLFHVVFPDKTVGYR